MKGLALNVVIGMIIGISSLIILLLLFSGTFKPAANTLYCKLYSRFVTLFNSKISLPQGCNSKENLIVVNVNENKNSEFSELLLGYIIACWKEAEIKGLNKSHPCYELRLMKTPIENVTEYNITQILIKEDHCESIENSDYGCGEENNIYWEVRDNNGNPIPIENQTIILLEYNATLNAVEVIG